jgi:hypothetical protein
VVERLLERESKKVIYLHIREIDCVTRKVNDTAPGIDC